MWKEREKKEIIKKSQQVTVCFTLIIYNPIAIIVQYDISLKYCQRRFCLIFVKEERARYILLRNHKTTPKGVYMVCGIESISQYFEGCIGLIHKLKTITKHIFSFSIVTCEQKIGKKQRNVWRKVAKNMVSPHNNSLIITITNLYEMC